MPFCGFNQEMLDGISGFHKGLVEHGILDRSKERNQTTDATINKELDDMKDFLQETHRIKEPELRELTEALASYARAYYKYIHKNGVENYKDVIKFLNNFYFSMDEKYYSELGGKPEAMKKLVLYLNGFKL